MQRMPVTSAKYAGKRFEALRFAASRSAGSVAKGVSPSLREYPTGWQKVQVPNWLFTAACLLPPTVRRVTLKGARQDSVNTLNESASNSAAPDTMSKWRLAFRIVRWSTYLAGFITLILVLRKSPPPQVQTTPQAAARAEEKVQQAEQSVSNGEPATVRLDETELNSLLASRLAQALGKNAAQSATPPQVGIASGTPDSSPVTASSGSDVPSSGDIEQMRSNVRDVKVQMEGDLVKAYVVFDVHGKDMTLELQGKLGAADGYLKFVPVSGQIGSLPIPQSALESAVQHVMDSPENREKLRLPPDISDLRIVNGELVTTYH